MHRKRSYLSLLLSSLVAVSCGGDQEDTPPLDAEQRTLRDTEERLSSRLQARYGERARVQRVFGTGPRVLLGIALEEPLPESDVIPSVAVAAYDREADTIDVITQKVTYREATPVGQHTALVSATGELSLLADDGSQRALLEGVRGDVAASVDGRHLALTLGAPNREHETAVAVTDLEGNVAVIADAPGVDDRPTLSPDGETLLFVSGRTGIASFYRTTVHGDPPVQLTNVGIKAGVPRTEDPPGFVPPPVVADRVEWLSDDVIRYDAGGGELWTLHVRTGLGAREGSVR